MEKLTEREQTSYSWELPETNIQQEFVLNEKPAYEILKRIFDIIASAVTLAVFSLGLLVILTALYLQDHGYPLFVQERIGRDGKTFKLYKLRTMCVGAENMRPQPPDHEDVTALSKIQNDPRVTKLGAFLRKFSIDELPQLINVLKGEMSIVGPRPLIPSEHHAVDEYLRSEWGISRSVIKPGLSSFAVLEQRSRDNYGRWSDLEIQYIMERSILTDIKIIFKTLYMIIYRGNK